MELEHSNFEEYLLKIRNLTNNYFIDSDACKTYRKVFEMLQELEKETIEHAGLENNILHKLAMKKELELC
jgi:regulator of cell morphogenesis and NO signaling